MPFLVIFKLGRFVLARKLDLANYGWRFVQVTLCLPEGQSVQVSGGLAIKLNSLGA